MFFRRSRDHSPHPETDHRDPRRPCADPAPLVDVDGVGVTVAETPLLAPTTLRVHAGEVVALRGANGTGKTTLLRALAGIVHPTTGAVRIGGVPVDEREPGFRRRVAAMIGLPPMASDLTVHDHVALIASTWCERADAVAGVTHAVLEELRISPLRTRFPHELSSGQTQLLGLAMVFARPFDVLLLDEPEQRLDAQRIGLLAHALLRRRAGGAAVLLATHSDALAAQVADRVIRLGGRR